MKEERILELFGKIDPEYIKEAEPVSRANRKKLWVSWGAVAACLCIMAAGVFLAARQGINSPVAGAGGSDIGGLFPEGVDPVTYSVAVYPATEDVRDVETADVTNVTENEVLAHPLAAYLPSQLPDGFHFGRGSLYETVMKDETQYHMLRIEYITGVIPEQQFTEDGGAIAPDLEVMGEHFLVLVMDYEPKTDKTVYTPEEVTWSLLEDSSDVYIRYGDFYVGVFIETADAAAVFEAVKNIG